MTIESAKGPPSPNGPEEGGARSASALRAAVRAVESGEASAAEFFTGSPASTVPGAPSGSSDRGTSASADWGAVGQAGTGRPLGTGHPTPVPQELVGLLATGGAPAALGPPLAAALGETAAEVLRQDPWAVLRAANIVPEQADGFARALAEAGAIEEPNEDLRGASLAVWVLEQAARRGDTAKETEALCQELAGHAVPDPRRALQDAAESGAVLLFEDPVPGSLPDAEGRLPVHVLASLEQHAAAEEALAEGLVRLRSTFPENSAQPYSAHGWGAVPEGDAATDRADVWRAVADRAVPSAGELVRVVAQQPVVLHTCTAAARNEPAALSAAAAELGLRSVCVGHARLPTAGATVGPNPTGEAARGEHLEPKTSVGTVADLLAGAADISLDTGGLLALDLLVVVDAEQLTTETAATLVELVPDGARLVLSGDPALLGPAGTGHPLTDLLATGVFPHVASRSAVPGPLGELASGVAAGELATVAAPEKEVVIVPVADPGEGLHRTVQLVTESIPRAFGQQGPGTAVLTMRHGGPVGTRAVNAALKEQLNPGPGRFGGFDPNDRVAWSPEPGRTVLGMLTGTGANGAVYVVPDESSTELTLTPGEGSLRHGWAVTAHQAAGLNWPAVVTVVPGDAGATLERAWVYTAFSRATQHLSVVQGAGPDLARAVAARPTPRTTRLTTVVRQAVADVTD